MVGEGPPEKVGCRKESCFLEFMYVERGRDFVEVVFHALGAERYVIIIIIIIIVIIINNANDNFIQL